jgi:hypothetical protein
MGIQLRKNKNSYVDWTAMENIIPGDLVSLNFVNKSNLVRYDPLTNFYFLEKNEYVWAPYPPIFVFISSKVRNIDLWEEQESIILYNEKYYATWSENVFKYEKKVIQ